MTDPDRAEDRRIEAIERVLKLEAALRDFRDQLKETLTCAASEDIASEVDDVVQAIDRLLQEDA
jgi:hypothetical protein